MSFSLNGCAVAERRAIGRVWAVAMAPLVANYVNEPVDESVSAVRNVSRELLVMNDLTPDFGEANVDACEMLENLPFTLEEGIGGRAKIGLIVLATDYTVEHEFRKVMTVPGVDFYQARIENVPTITPETLADMETRIPGALRQILPGEPLDVVAYGCTSASIVLGEDTVFSRVREVQPEAKCTTPITAAFAAFDAFRAKRIAVLTPYRRDVNERVRAYIEGAGYTVPVFGSFNEEQDPTVARIDTVSLSNAIDVITKDRDVDMVFVSCTSVRLFEAAKTIEDRIGLPVTSSNHAMAWHCLRLAGVEEPMPQWGQLYEKPLPAA